MATVDELYATNQSDAVKAGRIWATLNLQGGKIVLCENGLFFQADNADRGNGTFGPEAWPVQAGFFR